MLESQLTRVAQLKLKLKTEHDPARRQRLLDQLGELTGQAEAEIKQTPRRVRKGPEQKFV